MDEETAVREDLGFPVAADVECDARTGRKRKAERSCLQCLASYCENHSDTHGGLHASAKRHKPVAATGRFGERVCPEHDKLMEVYCRTDRRRICHLCIANKHRGHDVVSVAREVAEVKSKLGSRQREITDRVRTRRSQMQELKQAIGDFKASAVQAVGESEKSFAELIHFVETKQRAAKELVLAREEAEVKKAEELLERLLSEINDLKKRDVELRRLERLSRADNGVRFLQGISSTPALPSSSSSPALFVQPYSSFELAVEAVSNLVKEMRHVCGLSFAAAPENGETAGETAEILSPPAPETRQALLQGASKLTLNPDTAHVSLRLSQENTKVTTTCQAQDYPEHPDRFDSRAQILCHEALPGTPQYWEAEYGGSDWVCFAVTYIGIARKGKRGRLFGRNRCSWGLRCYPASYEFWHDDEQVSVPHNKPCSRIGVYLDHGLGILEFYNVLDDTSLIYKAHAKFSEPVYAGFGLAGKGTYIKLCDLEEEAMSEKKKKKNVALSYSSDRLT